MPVTPGGLGELARLLQAVLPGGGVQHQQHFVRRVGNHALGRAAHLLQLRHQVRLWSAGGRRYPRSRNRSCAPCAACSASNSTALGSRAGLLADHLGAGALAPDFQLLDGGGAERVGGAQQHAAPFVLEAAAPACRWWWSCPRRSRPPPGSRPAARPRAAWAARSACRISSRCSRIRPFSSRGVAHLVAVHALRGCAPESPRWCARRCRR